RNENEPPPFEGAQEWDPNDPKSQQRYSKAKAKANSKHHPHGPYYDPNKDKLWAPPKLYWPGGPVDKPPFGWNIKNILAAGGVAFLSAPTSAGKTYIGGETAAAHYLGEDYRFAGQLVKRTGGTLIWAAEYAAQWPSRLDALQRFKINPALRARGIEPPAELP